MSQAVNQEALTRVFWAEGNITEEDSLEMVKVVDGEKKRDRE